MKLFITIIFCFLLFTSCQSSGTGALIKITDKENILIVVCGGAGVTFAQIEAWKQKLDNNPIDVDVKDSVT